MSPAVVSVITRSTGPLTLLSYTLPVAAKTIVNRLLKKMPGFSGSVDSVSLHFLSGRIDIHHMVIDKKVTREKAEPFLSIPRLSLSLSWKHLFSRQIIGDVMIEQPRLTIATSQWTDELSDRPDNDRRAQTPFRWLEQWKRAIPLNLNVSVRKGTAEISDLADSGSESLMLQNIDVQVQNLANRDRLANGPVTTADIHCRVASDGDLDGKVEGQLLETVPTFKADLKLRGVHLTQLRAMFRRHFDVDVTDGTLELFAEVDVRGNKFAGYAKPIFDHLRIEPIERPGVWARFKAAMFQGLIRFLRNPEQDRVATRINFAGSLDSPHVDRVTAVLNFVKNSFGAAFKARLDHRLTDYFRHRAAESETTYYANPALSGQWWAMIQASSSRWLKDDVPRMSAALSYYTCFSLAPLLLLVIAVIGLVFGRQAAEGHILSQLSALVGRQSAETIQTMIAAAWQPSKGVFALSVSIITLLVGAFGVLSELKSGLNRVMKSAEVSGIGAIVMDRAKYLGFILGIGFLLLVSLAISTALSAMGHILANALPAPHLVLQIIDAVLSVGVISVLFAMMFRYLPNSRLPWRPIWLGSVFTAVLFVVGKFSLGLYLARSGTTSSYGSAGSILVMLLWVYYSSLILYYGAEFTKVYSEAHALT